PLLYTLSLHDALPICALCAIAIAVSALHACAGAKPRNVASASASYGTCASISSREPPGTRSNSPTAPLPPPVIASAALRPDTCNVEINCCHAASDGLMVRVSSEAENYLANGETQLGQCQQARKTMNDLPL